MKHHLIVIILWAIYMIGTSGCHARVIHCYSAEWLAHDCDLIAVVEPMEVEVTYYKGDTWFTRTRVRIQNNIKGPLSDGDIITVWDSHEKDPLGLAAATKVHRKMLMFAKVAFNSFPELNGRYMVAKFSSYRGAFYMDSPVQEIFSPESVRITEVEEVLRRARAQVAKERHLKERYWKGSIVEKSVNMGPAMYLRVLEYQEPAEK